MKFIKYFNFFNFFLLIFCAAALFSPARAQNFPAPRENKLLNGARLLVWNDKQTEKVTVKIRIHSGSAFDPLGKEGTMQLLSDILFPSPTTREFFTEDLNGSFEVVTNYDYIQINASGDAEKFLSILETLASAVTNPQIDKETTEIVKTPLLAKVRELEKNPAYIADRAAAKRLLGNFPYGRPQSGTSESLTKIDFADLLLADQKFFTADNATIAVSGSVNPDFALRAVKRLFGGWLKADKKVPATFAQPDAPTVNQFKLEMPELEKTYITTAIDTVGRSDKDFWATQVLAKILKQKYCLSYEPHLLRGIFYIRQTPDNSSTNGTCRLLGLTDKISQAEFDSAKQSLLLEFRQKTQSAADLLDLWLDAETYKLVSVKDELQKINAVMFADVQRVDEKMRKQPTVTVSLIGQTEQKQNN